MWSCQIPRQARPFVRIRQRSVDVLWPCTCTHQRCEGRWEAKAHTWIKLGSGKDTQRSNQLWRTRKVAFLRWRASETQYRRFWERAPGRRNPVTTVPQYARDLVEWEMRSTPLRETLPLDSRDSSRDSERNLDISRIDIITDALKDERGSQQNCNSVSSTGGTHN